MKHLTTGLNTPAKTYVSGFAPLITACLILVVLTTCGNDSPTKPQPTDPPTQPTPPPVQLVPTSIVITPSATTLTSIGQTVRLTAVVRDQNSQPMPGANVTWSSGNGSVATVNAQGLVTAVGNGSTQITARSGTATASIAVTVAQSATRITIAPESATLMSIGATVQLAATVLDQNDQPVSGATVTWTSSDVNVATVSFQGLVTAVMNGSTQITARSGSTSASVTVTVLETISDREALVALYQSTNGSNWTNSTNWLSSEPLNTWYGVRTNANGLVASLSLIGNNLSGSIPPEIGQLQTITWLGLAENQLSGNIPPEIGQLLNLRNLRIDGNLLTGTIPPEIGLLQNLRSLLLYGNQLTGTIPPELAQLSDLSTLDLSNNRLSGSIPPELAQLSNLSTLDLAGNQLSGLIPPEIAQLNKLSDFNVSENLGLTGPLPEAFLGLAELERFLFDGTQICVPATTQFQEWFKKIPNRSSGLTTCPSPQRDALIALYDRTDGPNWTNSTNWNSFEPLDQWHGITTDAEDRVTGIELENNSLSGSIPSNLGNLTSLMSLNLSFNSSLSGTIPYALTNLNLEELALAGTMLCAPADTVIQQWLDSIPQSNIANCTETRLDYFPLAALYYSTNGSAWANNTNWLSEKPLNTWYGVSTNASGEVTHLDLLANNLQGPIPPEIGQLVNLSFLYVSDNELTGNIPSEIGQLTNLTTLWLQKNRLTGSIPPEIGQLESLEVLLLFSIPLTGDIPAEIGQLKSLKELTIYHNELTGSVPPEIGQLTNLESLNIGGNALTGGIPPEVGQLKKLTRLRFESTEITGDIPPEIGKLENLKSLELVNNMLTGNIPPEIGQIASLEKLWLIDSQLSGEIPPEIGQLQNLTELSLQSNKLTGAIPPEIGQLQNIEIIELYENRLNGSIPQELGELQKLTRLHLHSNELTGQIPLELGQLSTLEELWLSHNQLTGGIPTSLGDLTSLRSLRLTENTGMSGTLPMALTLLELDELLLGGTQLCAPDVGEFHTWLRTIANSRVAHCDRNVSGSRFYLTQATQSFDYPVPLIAGEDALLRVFVTSESEATMPVVRATFYQDGSQVHTDEISGSGILIPRQIDEGVLTASANTRIPGSVIMPGLEMVIEIDPDGELDPSLGISERLPPTGRISMDVYFMPPFKLTIVPFQWTENPDGDLLARVESLSAESEMFRYTRDLLPVGEFDLDIREPVWTSVEPVLSNGFHIRNETKVIRVMDGASGHYMGVLSGGGGVAELPGKVIASGLFPGGIAHELGHNLNLYHAPCGDAGGPDPDYPYPDGSIGAWGYDLLNETLVSPNDAWDLMSYCGPYWISDYSFSRALGYRLSQEVEPPLTAAFAPSARSLLLWGGVTEEGDLILEPSYMVDAPSTLPDLDGPYLLIGEGLDGSTLFNLSFGMAEIADGEGGSFAIILPMRYDWANRLARITLSGPEGVAVLGGDEYENDRDTTDTPSAALLLDSVTGKVRGILRDWPEPGITGAAARRVLPEPGLDLVISNGVPTPSDWDR